MTRRPIQTLVVGLQPSHELASFCLSGCFSKHKIVCGRQRSRCAALQRAGRPSNRDPRETTSELTLGVSSGVC